MPDIGFGELLGLTLAIIGFAVGLWHLREISKVQTDMNQQAREISKVQTDMNQQAAEAREHTKALDEIRLSMSTRYIGTFPDYVFEIVRLIEEAKQEIVIFCDLPAYASISNPSGFLAYRQAIERKLNQGVRVSLTCLDEARRSEFYQEQFFTPEDGQERWERDPVVGERLRSFLKSHGQASNIEDLTKNDILKIFTEENRRVLEGSFAGATRREIDAQLSVYFWIVDKSKAIFSIASLSARALEYGFSTIDAKLIAAFEDMMARFHRQHASTAGTADKVDKQRLIPIRR